MAPLSSSNCCQFAFCVVVILYTSSLKPARWLRSVPPACCSLAEVIGTGMDLAKYLCKKSSILIRSCWNCVACDRHTTDYINLADLKVAIKSPKSLKIIGRLRSGTPLTTGLEGGRELKASISEEDKIDTVFGRQTRVFFESLPQYYWRYIVGNLHFPFEKCLFIFFLIVFQMIEFLTFLP
jgi:hypothetical protein